MNARGPRCGKHPSHLLVGVCAFCLRERLAGLADVECASDGHHYKKKKQSPGRPLAASGSRKEPADKRASDRPTSSVHHEHVASSNVPQDDSFPRLSATSLQGIASKGVDKSVVIETTSVQSAAMKRPNRLPVSGTSPKTAAAKAHHPVIAKSPRAKDTKGSGSNPTTAADMGFDVSSMKPQPTGRYSFSSTKRPSFTQLDCDKLPPLDIKLPILDSVQSTATDSNCKSLSQKHAAVACMPPRNDSAEHAKLSSSLCQGHHLASFEPEKNIANTANGLHAMQRSRPIPEPAIATAKDEEIILSDASPDLRQKKKTLSSLFSLDDADFLSSKAKAEQLKGKSNAKADIAPSTQHLSHAKSMQRKCKHGSFSERVEPSTYLFPVPEAVNSKSVSWFSSLFRRRKKKCHSKQGETLASYTDCNNGWEDARQSWDAPRPSTWEQFRLSSFEGPRSSWEPARPSWEGVMRTSDAESVFSGFDHSLESLIDVKEDVQAHMQRNKQEPTAVDRCSLDSKRLGSKLKPLAPKPLPSDDKARPHSFLPVKTTLMQRDVSTQTTPPRSSDANEIFVQQRLHQGYHVNQQHQVKPPHAIWSKVWTKTFSNSKWAFKQKNLRERQAKEMADTMVSADEAKEQGNMTLGRASFHEGAKTASDYHPKLTFIDNIEEHEAWDTFYSPLQEGKDAMARLVSKSDMCIQKEEQLDKAKGSNVAVQNGLLKFYLTPVRGHSKTKQGIHGL